MNPVLRIRFGVLWKSCACVLLLSGCGTLSKMEIDKTDAEAMHFAQQGDLAAEVDSLAQPLVERGETPGIVVGVLLPDGSRQVFGYGRIDLASEIRPNGQTLFAIGSLSKGFLGALAAVLVQEGTLSWNDTLGTLLPGKILSADAKKITLIQLATHTSGLPNQPKNFQTFRYVIQYLFTGKSFYRHLDQTYVLSFLEHYEAPPHRGICYSSLGYALLGFVIEQRTGLTEQALLEQKLLHPLGLKNTSFSPQALPGYAVRARGHAGDHPFFIQPGHPVPDWQFTEFMKGTGGLYSTADDLLSFAAAHFQDQTPLGTALKDTLQVRRPRSKEAPAIAWFVDTLDGQKIAYQVGVVGGFTSYIGLDVERQTAVVVLQNSFRWTNKVGHKLLVRLSRAQPKKETIK